MSWLIYLKLCIFGQSLWNTKLYIIEFPSKWAVVEFFIIKYVKVMLGQSSIDFCLRKPYLETLTFDQILTFFDESWSAFDQMMNMTSKYWCWPKIMKFDCMLTIVDLLSNTADFQPSEQLDEQLTLVRLGTWYEDSLRYMKRYDDHLKHWKSIVTWE